MKKFTAFALLSIFALSGCGDSAVTTDGGVGHGTVIGRIAMIDEFQQPLVNYKGITISLEGTHYSAELDSSGTWEISTPGGSYVALFSKDGYVTRKLFNFIVPVSGTFYFRGYFEGKYSQFPEIYFFLRVPDYITSKDLVLRPFETQKTVTYHDSTYRDSLDRIIHLYVYDTINVPYESAPFSMRVSMPKTSTLTTNSGLNINSYIFCSKNSNIDPINNRNELTEFSSGTSLNEEKDTISTVILSRSKLLKAGYNSGDRIYCVGYSTFMWLSKYNYDLITELYLPAVLSKNHTEVKSFILP